MSLSLGTLHVQHQCANANGRQDNFGTPQVAKKDRVDNIDGPSKPNVLIPVTISLLVFFLFTEYPLFFYYETRTVFSSRGFTCTNF